MTAPAEVVDEVPVDLAAGRVYTEGWQSWSPATWYPVTARGRVPEDRTEHLMRFRPGTAPASAGFQAEGVLVVDPGDGAPARLYGATECGDIPTVSAELHHDHLVVRATGPVSTHPHEQDAAFALASYADELARASGALPVADPPAVWCSWYRYFEDVTAGDIEENVRGFDLEGLRVDVVQIDDGWSPGLGEGLHVAERFGSLPSVVDTVRSAGRRVGIWLAPFLVGADTTVARERAEWLVGPAGHNWGQDLVGLDLTHPGVQEVLQDALAGLVALGVDYLKLDFLYAGAVRGPRYDGSDPVAAYRSGLALVRRTVGPDVYLVGCGAPLLPSVGLVDAMRVSPDTFHEGGEDGSTGLRGLMPLAARAWQQGRLWANDPDCVVARPSFSQRARWAEAAHDLGGLPSFSDRVGELDAWGLDTVRTLLAGGGRAAPFPLERVRAGAHLAMAEASR